MATGTMTKLENDAFEAKQIRAAAREAMPEPSRLGRQAARVRAWGGTPETGPQTLGWRAVARDTATGLAGRVGLPATELRDILERATAGVESQERADVVQALGLKLLEAKVLAHLDGARDRAAATYAVCRNWVRNWWEYRRHRQHDSLDGLGVKLDGDGQEYISYDGLLEEEIDWELHAVGRVRAQEIWRKLPPQVQRAVSKRIQGVALSGADRMAMTRYLRTGVSPDSI